MTTPNFQIPEVNTSTLSFTQLNTILRYYEQLGQTITSGTFDTPPSSPTDGIAYIVGTSPTGVFVGQENNIAFSVGGAYYFLVTSATNVGMTLYDLVDMNPKIWTGSEWLNTTSGSSIIASQNASITLSYAATYALDSTNASLTYTLPVISIPAVMVIVNDGALAFTVNYSGSTINLSPGVAQRFFHKTGGSWILS